MTYLVIILLETSNAALTPLVLSVSWMWFIVPLGVPAIGYWQAMGVNLLVSYTTHQVPLKSPEVDAGDRLSTAIARLVITFAVWGLGSLIHGQMA